jgi:hypothetical protein
VAVKFFYKLQDFHVEAALYASPAIAKLLPPLKQACCNTDGAVRTANGFVWPPHIVTERGSPLSEVRAHLAHRLVEKSRCSSQDRCV